MKTGAITYAICRLDSKYWRDIPNELSSRGYTKLKLIVPTVRVPAKNRKSRGEYIEVPYLFSYGFMRMSTKRAFNRSFLRKLKKDIPGINGWPLNTVPMHSKKLRKRIDNADDWDDFSKVATVTKEQVKYYQELAKVASIYSKEDILSMNIGTYITLDFYPFEGMGAQIMDINLNTQLVSLKIHSDPVSLDIRVPLDQVVYTHYMKEEDNLIIDRLNAITLEDLEDGEISTASLGMSD